MIYVVSDLHGSNKKLQRLLDEIRFTDKDIMYVLGDIVDYGEDSIELLCDLSMRFNVIPIVGDHDYRAVRLLRALNDMLNDGVRPDADVIGEMAAWMEDGGAKVMEDFKALDSDMREGVNIHIGDENPIDEMKSFSVITATYCVNKKIYGSIGIIGPKRMNYPKVVSLIDNVVDELTQHLLALGEGKSDNEK